MAGRIITARHGRPNLSRDMRITAREYGEWWKRYDEAGLHRDEAPPESLVRLASGAKTVLSSTLPRAIETARHVTGGARVIPADALYVEAPLPPPPIPLVRLRPGQWGVVSRAYWVMGYAPERVEHVRDTWRRVDRIIARLAGYAQGGDVVLCAHGYLNWMIDYRITRAGWRREAREGGHKYWSWRLYAPTQNMATVGEGAEPTAAADLIPSAARGRT